MQADITSHAHTGKNKEQEIQNNEVKNLMLVYSNKINK